MHLNTVVGNTFSYQTLSYFSPFNAIQHYRTGGTDQTLSYFLIFRRTKKRQSFAHHCCKWLIPNSFIYSTVSSNWPYIDYPKFRKAIAFCKNTEEIMVLNGTSSLFDSEQKCKQRFSRLCTFRFRVQVKPVQMNFGQIII